MRKTGKQLELSKILRIFAAERKNKCMEAVLTSEDIVLTIPNDDMSFLRTLTKKMGWTMKRRRKTGIEKGLEDIRKGRVYKAKDSEDLIKQILVYV